MPQNPTPDPQYPDPQLLLYIATEELAQQGRVLGSAITSAKKLLVASTVPLALVTILPAQQGSGQPLLEALRWLLIAGGAMATLWLFYNVGRVVRPRHLAGYSSLGDLLARGAIETSTLASEIEDRHAENQAAVSVVTNALAAAYIGFAAQTAMFALAAALR